MRPRHWLAFGEGKESIDRAVGEVFEEAVGDKEEMVVDS